jgi:hypothetical protein
MDSLSWVSLGYFRIVTGFLPHSRPFSQRKRRFFLNGMERFSDYLIPIGENQFRIRGHGLTITLAENHFDFKKPILGHKFRTVLTRGKSWNKIRLLLKELKGQPNFPILDW